jgi:hypothetical protein
MSAVDPWAELRETIQTAADALEQATEPPPAPVPAVEPIATSLRMRGRKLLLTLTPDLIDAVDAIAAVEDRSRAKMIEIALRRFVQEHAAQRTAA